MSKRLKGYGVGAATIGVAPEAIKSNGVPVNSSQKYTLGQLVRNTATGQWLIYNGEQDQYTVIGDVGIETINTIAPDALQNFTVAAGAGITITPGTNQITVAASGGGVGVDTFLTDFNSPCKPNGSGEIDMFGASNTIYSDANVANSNVLHLEVYGAQHRIFVGTGGSTPANTIIPSATSGIPLVSNGLAADPSYSTAQVVGGGTGLVSTVPYAVLAGGTSSTTPLQQVSGLGTLGQVLTSSGAGSLPTWQTTVSTSPVKFFARLSASDPAVTGAGASYFFGSANVLTVTQTGSAMATNGVFTAPTTGFYSFTATLLLESITAAMANLNLEFKVDGTDIYFGQNQNAASMRNNSNALACNISANIFLTASQTVVLLLGVFNGAGDTVGVDGGAITLPTSHWSGFQVI